MLKLSTYLIIVLMFLGCSTTRVDTVPIEQCQVLLSDPGKCYYSIKHNDTVEWDESEAFIVEITEAVIDTVVLSYTRDELAKIQDLQNRVTFRIREPYISYYLRNDAIRDLNYQRDTAYVYCALEHAAVYRYIDLDTLSTVDLELKLYKLKNKATITKRQCRKGDILDNKNTFYGEEGRWSEVRELVTGSNCPLTDLPLKVQKSLINRGYQLELTGKLDEPTKAALLDFQKNNKLQQGSLNYDTIKKLNIK